MDFLIKRYEGGAMSTYIHDMKPGEEVAFKGPLPKHQWKANEFEHVGLVAGGTGIGKPRAWTGQLFGGTH